MPRYLIRRDIPNASAMSDSDLAGASSQSCSVLRKMTGIHWVQSYVAGDHIFCVYDADNESLLREHAETAGFPANEITEISRTIDPTWDRAAKNA